MTRTADLRNRGRRCIALLLVACALLLRIAVPAGWMPQAHATGIALSWCNDSGMSGSAALAEAKALLADAVGEKPAPAHKPAPDQPCAFAAAAQPLATADSVPVPPAPVAQEASAPLRLALVPGRGLSAPPPRSTGPPTLA